MKINSLTSYTDHCAAVAGEGDDEVPDDGLDTVQAGVDENAMDGENAFILPDGVA